MNTQFLPQTIVFVGDFMGAIVSGNDGDVATRLPNPVHAHTRATCVTVMLARGIDGAAVGYTTQQQQYQQQPQQP